MTTWDPMKHPHGVHGRWATVGGLKTGRKKIDRSTLEGRGSLSPNAFRPRPSATEARRRKEALPRRVRRMRNLYDRRAAGESLSFRDREDISYQAPSLRDAQKAKTGDAVIPREIALAKTRKESRGVRTGWRSRRTSVAKTPTGKTVAVRGEEIGGPRVRKKFGERTKPSARQLMAVPTHPTFTRKELSLKTSAWMRDRLKERGIAIPKGAREKQLIDLLASD